MKMYESFSKLDEVNLFTMKSENLQKIFKEYDIRYRFNIVSVFNRFRNLNFIVRILFTIKIFSKKFNKIDFYI